MPSSLAQQPWHWRVPLLLLALGTWAAWGWDWDLRLAQWAYDPQDAIGWPLGREPLWEILYRWGELPAVALAAGGLLTWGWPALFGRAGGLELARRASAGLMLAVAIWLGPGLLINGALKPLMGRPRPVQLTQFGGLERFQPVLLATDQSQNSSFPSGHAGAAFTVVALYFVWRGQRPLWAWTALGLGLTYGALVSAARMLQGGHFFSDVLWAGGLSYLVAYGVAWWWERKGWLEAPPGPAPEKPSPPLRRWGVVLAGALIMGVYLYRLPAHVHREFALNELPQGLAVAVWTGGATDEFSRKTLGDTQAPRLVFAFTGQATPWAMFQGQVTLHRDAKPWQVEARVAPSWGVVEGHRKWVWVEAPARSITTNGRPLP